MKSSRVRIAAIYWHMFSVGGVNTCLQNYKKTALQEGDVFDILRSDPHVTQAQERYSKPKRIRGGDTFIDVDGCAGHHPSHIKKTLKFLHENYDGLYFASITPHHGKWYGPVPHFIPIFTETRLPKVANISDGYWDTYADWGRLVIKTLKILYTEVRAHAIPLQAEGIPIVIQPHPFFPKEVKGHRSKEMLTVWPHQWKGIKGIELFLKQVPEIPGRIELYNTGLEYFNNRGNAIWNRAIKTDHFRKGFDGQGKADYFGWIPLDAMPEVYRRAWFSVGLQGITAKPPKTSLFGDKINDPRAIYSEGSFNNSETESLFYGAVPVLHEQVLKSDLPKDCILTVKRAEELPGLLKSKSSQDFVLDSRREKRAREFVSHTNDPVRIYRELKAAMGLR